MPAPSRRPGPLRTPTAPGSAPRAASQSVGPGAEPLPASRTPSTPGQLAAARRAVLPGRPGRAGPADPEAPRLHTPEGRPPEASLPAVPLRAPPAGGRHTPGEPARIRKWRALPAGVPRPPSQQLSPPPSSEPSGRSRPGQEAAPVAPAERHDRLGAPAPPARRRRRTAPVSRGPEAGSTGWSPGSSAGRGEPQRSARGPAARRTC